MKAASQMYNHTDGQTVFGCGITCHRPVSNYGPLDTVNHSLTLYTHNDPLCC